MRTARLGPETTAGEIRALVPRGRDVEAEVRAIVDEVRAGGDDAVRSLTARFDHAELAPSELRVSLNEIEAAVSALEPAVLRGLRTAIANVREVARAGMRKEPRRVELPERHVVELEELFTSTARLIANPVSHKLKAAAIDDLLTRLRDGS